MDKFEIGDKVNFVVERSLLSGVITKFYKNPYGEEECSIKTEIKTFPHILLQRVKKVSDEDDLISKIADLEAKLAEAKKEISEYTMVVDDLHKQLSNKCDFCEERYKQQIAEKEKEKDYCKDLYFNALKKQERTNKVVRQFQQRLTYFCEYFSKEDQDKISFAVEKLEKVKEWLWDSINDETPCGDVVGVREAIDNQIEELKKEMK